MLNRRHLRIKILQALYAYEQSVDGNITRAEKELFHSIQKMYDMYLYLLLLMIELRDVAEQRIEEGLRKKLPTPEDLQPNRRFADNKLLALLAANKELQHSAEKSKVNWMGEGELLRRLFKAVMQTEEYEQYMQGAAPDFDADREVVIRLFKRHLINHEALQYFFEEKSIFWVDDLDIVASMTIKTLKQYHSDKDQASLLPLWKEPDEETQFVKSLFRKSIAQSDEHMALIRKYAENWEVERIALMDTILMKMALAEAKSFTQIPVKVTLNEYIELAKYYSTPKSSIFINGVLDKLFAELKDLGTIKKVGRGLIN